MFGTHKGKIKVEFENQYYQSKWHVYIWDGKKGENYLEMNTVHRALVNRLGFVDDISWVSKKDVEYLRMALKLTDYGIIDDLLKCPLKVLKPRLAMETV